MQFKHPEFLYALLLLIIPIIVHLFQLQRFVKIPFTNVKFLKKIELQTRKSSQLKKWLILTTRLLLFTSLILAFTQPYFSKIKKDTKGHTIIYLDNSMSMGIKNGQQGILKNTVQKILKNIQPNTNISLITNDKIYKNLDYKSFKNELLNLEYSSRFQNFTTISLKVKNLLPKKSNATDNIVLISDFHNIKNINKLDVTNVNTSFSLINVAPKQFKNSILDSVYISNKNNQEITLKVVLKNINTLNKNVSVSIFSDTGLIGKTTTPFQENITSEVEFKIPFEKDFNGKIVIGKDFLDFDNTLFFSISKPEKIQVICIGKKSDFLSKIYTSDESYFQHKHISEIDYNKIKNQHLIILNEIENIPNTLINSLKSFKKNGGTLIIVPSNEINLNSYNTFFNELNIGKIIKSATEDLKVTKINYDHPLLKNVFEKKILNFQYPTTTIHYTTKLRNASSIISLENQQAFISQIKSKEEGNVYWFNSPLNLKNSNFQKSPLIVPVFYNIGMHSYQFPELYYTIGKENTIEVSATIKKDEVLQLKNNLESFIPIQQIFHNKIQLKTTDIPSKSGHYEILYKNNLLKTIAYNYSRRESQLKYSNLTELFKNVDNVTISNSIEDTFIKLNKQQQIKSLFKWFLGLTILFLLLEMCILKFFKT